MAIFTAKNVLGKGTGAQTQSRQKVFCPMKNEKNNRSKL